MTFFRKQVSLFNCLSQHIARSFTQTLYIGKGSENTETRAFCQYVALALRRVPGHIYIYYRAWSISISILLISVGLASLSQLALVSGYCDKLNAMGHTTNFLTNVKLKCLIRILIITLTFLESQ